MSNRLQAEIKQRVPWDSLEEEAYLNLVRTVDELNQGGATVLKPFGITRTQYNVLRILRGAEPEGLRCAEIGERLVTKDPDVTRLLDRLDKRHLITRIRDPEDRRVVRTRITSVGLEVLSELDGPVKEAHRASLGHLGAAGLRELIALLEVVRAGQD